MPPYQGGGDMISSVTFEEVAYNTLPSKFEAGTPDIAGAIGLAAAIEYLERDRLAAASDARGGARAVRRGAAVRVRRRDADRPGRAQGRRSSRSSWTAHPHDIGTILDREGVAIRTGHHCASR